MSDSNEIILNHILVGQDRAKNETIGAIKEAAASNEKSMTDMAKAQGDMIAEMKNIPAIVESIKQSLDAILAKEPAPQVESEAMKMLVELKKLEQLPMILDVLNKILEEIQKPCQVQLTLE